MSIIDHIESYVGPIQEGWKDKRSGLNIQIIRCCDEIDESVDHFLSLGFSDFVLEVSPEKNARHEFLFSVRFFDDYSLVFSFLMTICEAVIVRAKAVLRGQYIRLPADVAAEMGFDALYCSIPMLQDHGFSGYDKVDPPVIFVWLIPIYSTELEFIEMNGWDRFEDMMVEQQPDLFSLSRKHIIQSE
ncbi:suppressor of fused domain protein [Thalassospira marina]|uniref:Suppressor of fused protein (SUFU) n=1 Tax=Thalassospira marina TaxID=2048283 RepID=A0A2N3KED1_9PROT|nr:suppressor of fused domain protein [Thalassospira marina]PKR48927.1 Suppressor of fused protein (SUFU) [Thalassospira marina]